jgi:hypothetical protein
MPRRLPKVCMAVLTTLLPLTAHPQDMPEGRVYIFHSRANGRCPALDLHVVATENGRLSGMVAWNNMKSMAYASGTINTQNKTFHMTAKEVGGVGRTSEVNVEGLVQTTGRLVGNVDIPERYALNLPDQVLIFNSTTKQVKLMMGHPNQWRTFAIDPLQQIEDRCEVPPPYGIYIKTGTEEFKADIKCGESYVIAFDANTLKYEAHPMTNAELTSKEHGTQLATKTISCPIAVPWFATPPSDGG